MGYLGIYCYYCEKIFCDGTVLYKQYLFCLLHANHGILSTSREISNSKWNHVMHHISYCKLKKVITIVLYKFLQQTNWIPPWFLFWPMILTKQDQEKWLILYLTLKSKPSISHIQYLIYIYHLPHTTQKI